MSTGDHLPVPREAATAVEPGPGRPFVPTRFRYDLPRHLSQADAAARFATDPRDSDSDITVSAAALVLCAGSDQAAALQAAADWASEAPHMEIHSIAWARVPGPVEETWEWHATLIVSSRDPRTREVDGSTHHGDRRT